MREARLQIIFVNPHAHHAYFTCLALSRLGPVQILCPPLLLQLWFGQWKHEGLRIGRSLVGTVFATPLVLIGFLLYKLKILSESSYCNLLGFAASLLASLDQRSLLYVYQDYLLPLLSANRSHLVLVEMIISTSPNQANYVNTLEVLQQASLVVTPCRQILEDIPAIKMPVQLAPYGGNKAAYRNKHVLVRRDPPIRDTRSLTIAARSHNHRKGIDILLGALALLHQQSSQCSISLNVVICGSVVDRANLRLISSLNQQSSGLQLQIHAGQLSQDSYINLLQKADLFVMPSRLESMSLAALEALWMGLPSILSLQCGVDHFKAGYHGRLIDPNNSEVLAGILTEILAYPQLLVQWREQLEQDRGLYRWDTYIEGVGKGVADMLRDQP